MADPTRAEWELLFNRALGHARRDRALAAQGLPAIGAEDIARHLREQDPIGQGVTLREVRREVTRAFAALAAAEFARNNPTQAPRRADIPFNRGIYANESEYKYRVIVASTVGGVVQPGGTLVEFGSSNRLTGDEITRRALREHLAQPQTKWDDYDTALNPHKGGVTYRVIPIAISRYEEQ